MKKKQTTIFFTLLFLTSFWLFRESFSIFFFQDDFFIMKIGRVQSFRDWLQVFIPRSDIQFYRPLSSETFYLVNHLLFGFSPWGFHVSAWIVWSIAVGFLYANTQWFFSQKHIRYLVTALYATSAIHYNSLFWIANVSYVFSAFWYFMGYYLWRKYPGRWWHSLVITVVYVLGLGSSEFLLTFPFILIADIFFLQRASWKQCWRLFLVLLLITGGYLWIRLFLYPPNIGTYHFEVNISVLSSYRWFLLFFLNWPESIKDYFLTVYKIKDEFVRSFPLELCVWLLSTFTVLFFLSLVPKNLFTFIISRRFLFAATWFLLTLTPIIFVPSHLSPHQGSIALFGWVLIIGMVFEAAYKRSATSYAQVFSFFLLVLWLMSTALSVSFNIRAHWIYRRSTLSRQWLDYVQNRYPDPKSGSEIRIPIDDKEVKVALNEGEAIRQMYDDPSLRVIFMAAP